MFKINIFSTFVAQQKNESLLMKKTTLLLLLLIVFFSSPRLLAQEGRKLASIENEQVPILLSVSGNNVRVQNAVPGSVLEVYNILGVRVTSLKIDSTDKTFTLNLPKGWYILKIENIARKIAIK